MGEFHLETARSILNEGLYELYTVLGSIAGMLGTVQATEAIKCLAGVGEPLCNALLTFDALTMDWQRFDFPKNEDCALCGAHPTITRLKEYAFKPCSKKI